MFFEAFGELNASFGGGFHQMYPTARRFRFQAQHAIGRTLVQTKTAMDAVVEFGEIQSGDLRTAGLLLFA
jgi:hypothetical protein